MDNAKTDLLMQNKIFLWLALAVGFILLLPFVAMQLEVAVPDPGSATQDGVNWTLADFIVAGMLLFGMGSIFILIARQISSTSSRVIAGVILLAITMYIWAELAVGIFTNWGS